MRLSIHVDLSQELPGAFYDVVFFVRFIVRCLTIFEVAVRSVCVLALEVGGGVLPCDGREVQLPHRGHTHSMGQSLL